jgi:hypothetical protein
LPSTFFVFDSPFLGALSFHAHFLSFFPKSDVPFFFFDFLGSPLDPAAFFGAAADFFFSRVVNRAVRGTI